MQASPAISFRGVDVVRDGRAVLTGIDWRVEEGERWVVLGPNGSGKTTLLRVAAAELRPSAGVADVLGRRLGRVDLRLLRADVAFVSAALVRALRPTLTVAEVVLTGKHAAFEPWWHSYDDGDRGRAAALLCELGVSHIAARAFGVVSEGERQQALLARALMSCPGLLLLDEPAAGLDLAARERLLARIHHLAEDGATPPLVLVTHHVEEIPAGTTHAALLAGGRVVAAGPVDDVLRDDHLTACYRLPVAVRRDGERWWARAG